MRRPPPPFGVALEIRGTGPERQQPAAVGERAERPSLQESAPGRPDRRVNERRLPHSLQPLRQVEILHQYGIGSRMSTEELRSACRDASGELTRPLGANSAR